MNDIQTIDQVPSLPVSSTLSDPIAMIPPTPSMPQEPLTPSSPLSKSPDITVVSPTPVSDEDSANKEDYWDRVLTGDTRTIPVPVRERAGIPNPLSEDDDAMLAGRVVQSWAVDHTPYTQEQIATGWGEVRKGLAQQLGTGDDDSELFLALSERRRIKQQESDQLNHIYSQAYDEVLSRGEVAQETRAKWHFVLPEHLQSVGVQMEERGADEAQDDRMRLAEVAGKVKTGVASLLKSEGVTNGPIKNFWFNQANQVVGMFQGSDVLSAMGMISAVAAMKDLDESDRAKVYRMVLSNKRERQSLLEGMVRSVERGVADIGYHTAQLGLNAYVLGVKALGEEGRRFAGVSPKWAENHAEYVEESARIFEDLKKYAQEDIAPLHHANDGLGEQLLLDSMYSAGPAALTFAGPVGIGLMASSELGRQMAEARQMNPHGDYAAQMTAATASGIGGAALSLGMSKLGQRVIDTALKTFKATRGASTVRALTQSIGAGGLHATGDIGMMTAENKAQELIQYGAQEIAAKATGKESGVPWAEWRESNMDPSAQVREAATLFPFLLLGAGKVSLRHFRDSSLLLRDGRVLKKFGVPEDNIHQIMSEADIDARSSLLREALQNQPMWGSLFLGKKASEWAHILEDANRPLFSSEQEARDFLEMGPIRAEKPWETSSLTSLAPHQKGDAPDAQMIADVMRERWLLRSGFPHLSNNQQNTHEDSSHQQIEQWDVAQRRGERESIARIRSREEAVLPPRLREGDVFDPSINRLRSQYLAEQIEEVNRRAYKMLLLRYDDSVAKDAGFTESEWNDLTVNTSQKMRNHLYNGVMSLSEGESWKDVREGMSSSWWQWWVGQDDLALNKSKSWLKICFDSIPEEKRWAIPLTQKIVQSGTTPSRQVVIDGLQELERYALDSSDNMRNHLPRDFRALCRLTWGMQSDVRSLSQLIPNLQDFDVMAGQGVPPLKSLEMLLRRHLDVPQTSESPFNLPTNVPQRNYSFMGDAMRVLGKIQPNLLESAVSSDGQALWRVKYPNGDVSAWHTKAQNVVRDMAAHLALVYSPVGRSKRTLIEHWDERLNQDWNIERLKSGEGALTLMDDLALRATSELVDQGFGQRSHRAPGEQLILSDDDAIVPLTQLMGHSAIRDRMDVYEKYVGPSSEMGADVSNTDVENAKGLLVSRMEIYRKASPLGMIEDKAEIVWDRLMRTGQLTPEMAWQALENLGRVKGKVADPYGDYVHLSEELSQLSKEYYMGRLNEHSVPASVSMWARYAVARPLPTKTQITTVKKKVSALLKTPPEKLSSTNRRHLAQWGEWSLTEEMRRLADSSESLTRQLEQSKLPSGFIDMLRDSAGMNLVIRAERMWALQGLGKGDCLPMMERYGHCLIQGNLLEVLPTHIAHDLTHDLARINDLPDQKIPIAKESTLAQAEVDHLAKCLSTHPEMSRWAPDEANQGQYLVLTEKERPPFDLPDETRSGRPWDASLDSAHLDSVPKTTNDWEWQRRNTLPIEWGDTSSATRAIKTLDLIRRDFRSRPLPTDHGIKWHDQLLTLTSASIPRGIPDNWTRDMPLMTGLKAIVDLESSINQESPHHITLPKGTHMPFIHNWGDALNRFETCVLYADPNDARHTVRLMPGMPEAPNREARAPYLVHAWHGAYFDADGHPARRMRDSYIPLEQFKGIEHQSISAREAQATRQESMREILNVIADPELQKKSWWHPQTGDSSLSESIIRLYEELGGRGDDAHHLQRLHDPDYIELLRFVAHLHNSPKWMAGGFEYGTPSHQVILDEGKTLQKMMLWREPDLDASNSKHKRATFFELLNHEDTRNRENEDSANIYPQDWGQKSQDANKERQNENYPNKIAIQNDSKQNRENAKYDEDLTSHKKTDNYTEEQIVSFGEEVEQRRKNNLNKLEELKNRESNEDTTTQELAHLIASKRKIMKQIYSDNLSFLEKNGMIVPPEKRGKFKVKKVIYHKDKFLESEDQGNMLPSVIEGMELIRSIISANKINVDSSIGICATMKEDNRSFYREGNINVRIPCNPTEVAHELAHIIEIKNKDILKQTAAFLYKRGRGESPKKLQALLSNKFYRDEELTFEDSWVERGGSSYTGKLYIKGYSSKMSREAFVNNTWATEIFSTGIQRLLESPVEFRKKDPEYFNFIKKQIQ